MFQPVLSLSGCGRTMSLSTKQRFRRSVYPTVDKVLGVVGLYALYTLDPDERTAVVDKDLGEVYELMDDLDLHEEAIFAALKYHEDGQKSKGNFRCIDPKNNNYQYHVHFFEVDGGYELNAHHEYRWEPDWSVDDPVEEYEHVEEGDIPFWVPDVFVRSYVHYIGSNFYYDMDEGVQWLAEVLEEEGIDYTSPT